MSTFTDFAGDFLADHRFQHIYAVRGFETPEECHAWRDGERTLFDDLEEWLEDEPIHPTHHLRQDERGLYWVALMDDVDAVNFKLRWSDHLIL